MLWFYTSKLDIYQSQLTPEHPQYRYIGREYGNMGACYQGMDCPSDCLRMHKQALQWRRQHLPPDDEKLGLHYSVLRQLT